MPNSTIDLQAVVDLQDSPAVVIDKNYQILAANARYCESYGVEPGCIVGCKCHQVSHRSSVPCHENGEQCPHREVFAKNEPFEVLHTHFDAEGNPDFVRIKAYPLQDTDGNTVLVEMIHRLATPVKLSCEELRMVGRSKSFLACVEHLSVAARTDSPVLIDGESGVGKELAARFVHDQSKRRSKPYVELNCAAITESLVEDELFGHERGAFTGCTGSKQGLFKLADGGTLFLDEVGEMSLPVQAKLLRVLDSGQFRRVGGQKQHTCDVRIIAATNRNLVQLVSDKLFREDLFFRIAGIQVTVPPLRDRRVDIIPLTQVLLERVSRDTGVRYNLTHDAVDLLKKYDFPGNVRELCNITHKATALSRDGVIDAEHIHLQGMAAQMHCNSNSPHHNGADVSSTSSGELSMSDLEAHHIATLLRTHGGNRRRVARILDISERTLYRKIDRYHLKGGC